MYFRKKKGKKLSEGISRGYDHHAYVAKDTISDVDQFGRRTILERHLKFNTAGPSRK